MLKIDKIRKPVVNVLRACCQCIASLLSMYCEPLARTKKKEGVPEF